MSSSLGFHLAILCEAIFDDLKGQCVGECVPPDSLTQKERSNVAFHSFPDSLSMELHTRNAIRDSYFSFAIQR